MTSRADVDAAMARASRGLPQKDVLLHGLYFAKQYLALEPPAVDEARRLLQVSPVDFFLARFVPLTVAAPP